MTFRISFAITFIVFLSGCGDTHPKTVEETIAAATRTLEAGRYVEFFETFVVPEELNQLKASDRFDDLVQNFQGSRASGLLKVLKSIQGTEPTMSEDGKIAWFETDIG